MTKNLGEARFLLLGTWLIGFALALVQAQTDVLSAWSCLLWASLSVVLGQMTARLNDAQTEYPDTWKIENALLRQMFWLLVLMFVALAVKPFWSEPHAGPAAAFTQKPSTDEKKAELSDKWTLCDPVDKGSMKVLVNCRLVTMVGISNSDTVKNEPQATSADPWDKMDKYASAFGAVLTAIGLMMAVLTGWVITLAADFRGQLKDLQMATKVDEKLVSAERMAVLLNAKTCLHTQWLDCVAGTPDHIMLTFVLRSFQWAEEGLTATADIAELARKLRHTADSLRNGAPHVEAKTRQTLREQFVPALELLVSDCLRQVLHLKGTQGASYREALGYLIRTIKAM